MSRITAGTEVTGTRIAGMNIVETKIIGTRIAEVKGTEAVAKAGNTRTNAGTCQPSLNLNIKAELGGTAIWQSLPTLIVDVNNTG